MVYEEILKFFGQQNFAAASTAGGVTGLNILFNRVGSEPVYCILVNHSGNHYLEAEQIQSIHYQLAAQIPERNILFLVTTDHVERDKKLTQLAGIRVWLVDSYDRRLLIYENQEDDFFGLKYGLTQVITETPQARAQAALQWKTAVRDNCFDPDECCLVYCTGGGWKCKRSRIYDFQRPPTAVYF